LTSTLDGDEWSGSRPGRFTPRKRAPGGEEKNSQPLSELEPPIILSVAQSYTAELSRLLCTICKRDESKISAAVMKFMKRTAVCTRSDYKKNLDIVKELNTQPFIENYRTNWRNHVF
jgi:hypothetical protein